MARIKYYYDTETCRYERIKVTTWDVVLNFLGFVAVSVVLAIGIVVISSDYFDSPEEAKLRQENKELLFQYKLLDKELDGVKDMLTVLQERDDDLYRVIFEADPIPSTVRNAGIGGAERYRQLLDQNLSQEALILQNFKKLDKLKKQMYIQTKSYDEVMAMALNKEKMLNSIPAIQPVSNKEKKRLASGFGMRPHPIYKKRKMHWGIDFSAPRGTPVYATGDGKVIRAKKSYSNHGYGHQLEIDHGYGYVTKYAHLYDFVVEPGEEVKRGQLIAYVGSTGGSTAPHLHYEVIKDGKKINPINFFFQGISDEDYEVLLELASIENESLG